MNYISQKRIDELISKVRQVLVIFVSGYQIDYLSLKQMTYIIVEFKKITRLIENQIQLKISNDKKEKEEEDNANKN